MLACPELPPASTKQQLLLSLSKDLALSYTEVLWKCGRDELWIWLTHNFQLIEQHYCCPLLLLLLWAEKKGTTDHHPVVKHSVYLLKSDFWFYCITESVKFSNLRGWYILGSYRLSLFVLISEFQKPQISGWGEGWSPLSPSSNVISVLCEPMRRIKLTILLWLLYDIFCHYNSILGRCKRCAEYFNCNIEFIRILTCGSLSGILILSTIFCWKEKIYLNFIIYFFSIAFWYIFQFDTYAPIFPQWNSTLCN